jgi:hypothetical protein
MDARTIDFEENFWRTQYRSRPYVSYGARVDDYLPAYRYGIDASIQFAGRSFSDMEETLSRNWPLARGRSSLKWTKARLAAQDSWTRTTGIIAALKAAAAAKDEPVAALKAAAAAKDEPVA